jgi:DNA-directed RNA polymerase specialized sigma24 family protein
METTEIDFDIRVSEERSQLFTRLYEDTFPKVATFVAHRGGSFEDAKDIFHDAIVIFYEKMVSKELEIKLAKDFYLVGIAKHLWIRKFKDDIIKTGLDEAEKQITLPEDFFDTSNDRLMSLLALTGKRCMDLLRAFYYDALPLNQIKATFGFSTVHSASVQKFKCIEKLRNTIQQKSMGYEDFN